MLDAEAARDEFVGQPIQQLGMRGTLAHAAEIVGRADDAASEMIMPDAIHHHARGQRIFGIGDPAGKLGARRGRVGRSFGDAVRQQDTRRPHAHAVAFILIIAACQ